MLPNSDIEADGLQTGEVVPRCLVGFAQGSGRSEHARRVETAGPQLNASRWTDGKRLVDTVR